MKNKFLRSLFIGRINTITLFLLLISCCFSGTVYAGVTVTAAGGGSSICSSKAVGGSAPGYTTLTPINIVEGNNSDLLGPATNTLILTAPAGWQFNPVLPALGYTTGANITAITGTITATTLTINITTNGMTTIDQFSITGLQVQATSTTSLAGSISTSSVPPGIAGITTATNFGSLSLTSPITPSVTIAASPAGPLCAGTTVTFTPTPVNGGGSPAYQWYLNGISVVTGSTYVNSTLTNGNTVYCVMTSTGPCLTGTTATSNTKIMTVNPAPAAISGSPVTCVGGSTRLSDMTTGGIWSSNDIYTALVDAAGNVTGTGVGTATISYIAAGCPALVRVTINNPPLAPVLSPTLATMCSGSTTTFSVSGTPAPATILSQNFSAGLGAWSVDNAGSIGMLAGGEWKVCGDGYINDQGLYHSPDNSSFAMSNADTSGSLSTTSSKLISPVFSLAAYSGATLTFQHAYAYWAAGDLNVNLDISTDGGSSWSALRNYAGTNVGSKTGFVTESFSLNDYLGMSNLRIRYYYYCHWGYYWAIDNVLISGISSIVTPTWSPATYLFTDAGLATPYTAGSAAATLYAHPPSIGTSGTVVYTVSAASSGCTATSTATVNYTPTPSAVTGIMSVCMGATTTLSDITAGGTWSSSNTAVASVGSVSGIVSGISAGTAPITYMLGTGCVATAVVTVNLTPGTIFGSRALCVGVSSSLSDVSPSGGHWSSSGTSLATIGSVTGIINPIGTGTVTMIYSITGGCSNSTIVTVNPLPLGITGTTSVCVGATTALTDATNGGTWTSGTTSVAIVVTGTGVVFGSSAGTTIITYMLGTGCIATAQVTVNPQLAITGTMNVCMGLATTLTNGVAGGTWSGSNISVATAGSGTGLITGVAAGTAIISYRLPTGCTSVTVFTVNPLPATITGTANVCVGLTTNLTDATGGGTWSSGNPVTAIIGSLNGIVLGQSAGTTIITYVLPTGCQATKVVTVNPLPLSINGAMRVCAGLTTLLTDATPGGSWNSADVAIATVIPGSGLVTGIAQGTAGITYTLPSGCVSSAIVTIDPLPAAISGSTSVCTGSSITLTDITTGGSWISGNTTAGTINTSGVGVLTGIGAGTTIVSYVLSTGCMTTRVVSVNPLPLVIAGSGAVCEGLSIALSDGSAGGNWSSTNTSVATVVGSTGIVTGIAAGIASVVYTLPTSCNTSRIITVNPLPAAISGIANVCVGSNVSLSNATPGGLWSTSVFTIGTVGSVSGIVTGITQGTVNVTYTLGTGCQQVSTITVNPLPPAISGTTSICIGTTTILTNTVAGGTWTSSNPTRAGVGSASGLVTGFVSGTVTITYTSTAGCIAVTGFTVNPLPVTITGPSTVCTGASITLSDASTGGTWTSGNSPVAAVGSGSGIVSGISPGTAVITYTLPTGCFNIKTISVNQTPAAIAGTTSICQGATATLSNSFTGGTWSSSNTSAVTIGSASGIIAGFATGSSSITYTYPGGCTASTQVSVNQSPAAIAGTFSVCAGSSVTLSDFIASGTWTSSSLPIATIGTGTGIINALSPGTAIITYTLSNGCFTTTQFTVNVMPSAIVGTLNVCSGFSTVLSDAVTGGSWNSSNPSIANIGSGTGLVSGSATGTATITYGYPTGCLVSAIVTVNATPLPISGASNICLGSTSTMSDSPPGGSWSSSNLLTASIGSSTGLVTSLAAGTTTISYSFSTGCAAAKTITINVQPAVISGPSLVCVGTNTTLTDSIGGGTWSSSNTGIASIGSATGLLSGIGAGSATISYSLGAGCVSTIVVSVNLLPSSVAGNLSLCAGGTTTLSDPFGGGGTWTSDNTSIATIGSLSGIVSGISAGTANITYTITTGCTLDTTITVNPLPAAITESNLLCLGGTTQMSDGTIGGTWTSGSAVATIGSATGIAFGNATGSATITYKLATGCLTTLDITVYPLPAPISGTSNICLGLSASLSDVTIGGVWSSSNSSVAAVGSLTGTVSALGTGTSTISYTLATGCATSTNITVNSLPTAIAGTGTVCAGLTTALTDASPGGTWSSGNISVATIGSLTGIVGGIGAGTATITYTLPTSCITTTIVTVYPLPAAVSGNSNVCSGSAITLSNSSSGGLWSTSNTLVGIIGTGGSLSGLSAGTVIVTYTLPTGCITTRNITVNALPAAITGPQGVCIGLGITLSDATPGGTWSSGNIAVASAGTATGVVTGISAGTAIITYATPIPGGTSCIAVDTITVNPLPSTISGTRSVCSGSVTTLIDASGTGTWVSANPSTATIGSASGVVTGYTAGTTLITYILPSVVGAACYTTAIVTVDPLPTPISGASSLCVGSSSGLSDLSTGGTWTSALSSVASIGSLTGILSGINAGTTSITYILPTGCNVSLLITVNPLPDIITGPFNVCQGANTTLTNTSTGGTWSSNNATIATIGSLSGIVTGQSAGTTIITYTLPTGCYRTTNITVNALPTPINGNLTFCVGLTSNLTDATPGGTWSSDNIGIATAGSLTGVITGIAAGTAGITYALTTGCAASKVVTLNVLAPISGNTFVCSGYTSTLSDASGFGTWTTSNVSVAPVTFTTGVVTGSSAGTATISFVLSPGCATSTVVTVNSLPSGILGNRSVCAGLATSLSDASGSGVWTSGNLSVASVDIATGLVSGVSPGTANITFTIGTGCTAQATVTVNPLPLGIYGTREICYGLTSTLTDPTPGGSWTSSAPLIATIGSGTGTMTGASAGNATITYTLPTGCLTTAAVIIDPLPAAITGTTGVCAGLNTNLSDATTGGTWSTTSSAIISIDAATGSASGLSAGTALVTYTLPTSCKVTTLVTVYPLPAAISGTTTLCAGSSVSLSDASAGGSWSTGLGPLITVGSATGVITAISAGSGIVTYTLPTGCFTTSVISVNPLPQNISGNRAVCIGLTTALTDTAAGGSWASVTPSIAAIGASSGIVSGIGAGTTLVIYTLPTGCLTTAVVTVNFLPASISGATSVCAGSNISLGNPTPGGHWSSDNTTIATVGSSSGTVTALSAGSTVITYTLPTGCIAVKTITVNPLPLNITGTLTVCAGSSIQLSDAISGGAWSSGASSIVTIGSTSGIANGLVAGTSVVTYTLSTGCYTSAVLTVNPLPAAIFGTLTVCAGLTTNLTSSAGGTWTSGNLLTANISTAGIATGMSAGTSGITYTYPTGCLVTTILTVNPLPIAITGPDAVCTGTTITLTDASAGGTWSITTSGAVASVGVTSGIVTGISSGLAIVTYTLPTGCTITKAETVFATPPAINGVLAVCAGLTSSLSDASASGTWTSSNTAVANIGSSSGIVTGVAAGTSIISYLLGTGCSTSVVVTINPLPAAISGTNTICTGLIYTLTDPEEGGTWSSAASGIATISTTTGNIIGTTPGSTIVTYTLPTGCINTLVVTVNPTPGAILGIDSICATANTIFSDTSAGGTWSSSNSSMASLGSATGLLNGLSAGVVNITYTLPQGCIATKQFTVNPLPSVIVGSRSVCLGTNVSFSDSLTGGTWTSTVPSVATIGLTSGIATGVALGTTVVTYTLPTGCTTSAIITVNPYPAPITGAALVCQGNFIMLSDIVPGGSWSSADPGIATVEAGTGKVIGVSGGSTTISYTMSTGCAVTKIVTVNPLYPVTGSTSLCAGSSYTFSDLATGGTWTSSTPFVVSISASGEALAHSSGITIISYSLPSGCSATLNVTVNLLPASYNVLGGGNYCAGSTGSLVQLNGSDPGVSYSIFRDTSFVASLPGTGSAIFFGPYSVTGTYAVSAVNSSTGCRSTMAGTAVINITPVVVPSVSVTTALGGTVCAGANATFKALSTNGGTSPSYQWFVNGLPVGSLSADSTYTFAPLSGQVVSVTMLSNAVCATPPAATGTFTVVTTISALPSLHISISPDDTVCAGTPVTIIPTPLYGGSAPAYHWIKNGTDAGWGSTYTYLPANGDNVLGVLHSNYTCLVTDTAYSNNINIAVMPAIIPAVVVTAHPGLTISAGQPDTLVAGVSNLAVATYQWRINGLDIPGATDDTYISGSFNNNDTIACFVTGTNSCGAASGIGAVVITVNNVGVDDIAKATNNVQLIPNPNNGMFTVLGNLGSCASISIEVTDMLGSIVYEHDSKAPNGNISQNIQLTGYLPNGMYLLTIFRKDNLGRSLGQNVVLHFVVRN